MRITHLISEEQWLKAQPASTIDKSISLSRDLLVPFFRHARCPLLPWTDELLTKLADAHRGADLDAACERVMDCFNEGALIEVFFGRLAHASELCQQAIQFIGSFVLKTGRLSMIRYAIQPFINQARLDRFGCRWEEALEKLRCLKSLHEGLPLAFVGLSSAHLEAIRQDYPDFLAKIHFQFITDTATTLLRANRYADVISFVRENEGDAVGLEGDILREALVVAVCGLGEREAGLRILGAYLSDPGNAHRAVFLLRQAELLHTLDSRANAETICNTLSKICLSGRIALGRMNLRLLLLLGGLLAHFGNDAASAIARTGVVCAAEQNDVIFQADFLRLLLRLPTDESERSIAKQELDGLLEDSYYGFARRRDIPGTFARKIDSLYQNLMAAPTSFVDGLSIRSEKLSATECGAT